LAEAGDATATHELTNLRLRQKRAEEAAVLLQRLADAGDNTAARRLAAVWLDQGRTDEAISLLQEQASAGDSDAAYQLVEIVGDRDPERADAVLRALAERGDWHAVRRLTQLYERQGRLDAAVALLGAKVAGGDLVAAKPLANLLIRAKRVDEAVNILLPLAQRGDNEAVVGVADTLIDERRLAAFEALADNGDDIASRIVAAFLSRRYDVKGLRRRADAGDQHAVAALAEPLPRPSARGIPVEVGEWIALAVASGMLGNAAYDAGKAVIRKVARPILTAVGGQAAAAASAPPPAPLTMDAATALAHEAVRTRCRAINIPPPDPANLRSSSVHQDERGQWTLLLHDAEHRRFRVRVPPQPPGAEEATVYLYIPPTPSRRSRP
jgi:tetratricopeptide (TPR) repeat protein